MLLYRLWRDNYFKSQANNAHVVYFETGQYNVPDIETNRLVLFIQSLKDTFKSSVYLFMVLQMIEAQIITTLLYPKTELMLLKKYFQDLGLMTTL